MLSGKKEDGHALARLFSQGELIAVRDEVIFLAIVVKTT